MGANVRALLEQIQFEVADSNTKQQVINLFNTIVVYKLPQISRQELEAMFGSEGLRKTRFAQQMIEEGPQEGLQIGRQRGLQEGELAAKLQTVPRLIARGVTVEAITDILELSIEQVRQAAK